VKQDREGNGSIRKKFRMNKFDRDGWEAGDEGHNCGGTEKDRYGE